MVSTALKKWVIVLGIGAVIWFLPCPHGLSLAAWHLFAIFVATIAGFILQPIPMGAVAFLSLTICAYGFRQRNNLAHCVCLLPVPWVY